MKKFWTVLALVAMALNFSSVQLWAEEAQTDAMVPAVVEGTSADEALLDKEAVKDDETSNQPADETKTTTVVTSSNSVAAAVSTDEKIDEIAPILADTTQSEAKVS